MADISITVDQKAVQQLIKQAPQSFELAIEGTLNDGASYSLALLKRYPPTRPQQRYRRTGTLGRSWSVRPITRTSSGWRIIIGSNGNIAPYNRYVQDRELQARIHAGRWQTAQDIAEQAAPQVQRFADTRIRYALAGL